jgi:hypothetical protein
MGRRPHLRRIPRTVAARAGRTPCRIELRCAGYDVRRQNASDDALDRALIWVESRHARLCPTYRRALDDGDLPRVIGSVVHEPMQQHVQRVWLSRCPVLEVTIAERQHGPA